MKPVRFFVLLLISTFYITISSLAQESKKEKVSIVDAQHYSNVFAEIRNYRIFLPPSYADNPLKRYPVIYFYHGWSQRFFGSSDHYADFDQGDENKGDNIANFVASHDVIVVKADGYNRSPDEKYYVRPYNIGPVETYRQFPLYFPELVEHIDSHYNTIADREHRGISGLSMGGFMTFWIAGKYPHLLSAAGNFCGSAEFVVGPKDFPVEYKHIDMYKNYDGVKLRLNYGDKDFIRGYHEDLNKVWPELLGNYEWKIYDAAHSTCGMGEMFGFLLKSFENPLARPSQWDHIDVYPDFSVWGYDVRSDRNVPGFTILENVDKRGFKCSVREFLPSGELLPFVNVSVTTPPIYEKNAEYVILDIDTRSSTTQHTVRSDNQGRLIIQLNGSSHEIGINKKGDKPNIRIVSAKVQDKGWITEEKEVILSIELVNKGLSVGKNVIAKLSTVKDNVIIKQDRSTFNDIAAGGMRNGQANFTFRVKPGIETVKFKLVIQDANKNEWVDFFEMPIKKDVPEIKEFEIADGKTFTVAKGGNDSETIELGSGNGDGFANPGESIVILVKDLQKYWRTDLQSADPYVNPFGVAVRKSDYWGNYDHVGASAKFDIPLIASNCPENHTIEFFAEYWLPDNPLHIIKQGVVKIEVKGKGDTTPPQVQWVQVTGENVVRAKIFDGSKIQSVKAKLILKNDPAKSFEVDLRDDGNAGDGTNGDNVFTKKIPTDKFGIYRVIIEASDSSGNKMIYERTDDFVVH